MFLCLACSYFLLAIDFTGLDSSSLTSTMALFIPVGADAGIIAGACGNKKY
jgi:hypothetical protein